MNGHGTGENVALMEGNDDGMMMDRNGIMGEKWLRYKVCLGLVERWAISLVECEIEVLYQILACGILKKMKIYPAQKIPAFVQKAGLHTCAIFVKSRPAWPYTSLGACLRGRGRRRVPWPWACLAYSQLHFNYVAVATFCSNSCIYNSYIYNY